MNLVEYIRKESVNALFQTNSFSNFWEHTNPSVQNSLTPMTASTIMNIGDQLGPLFRGNLTERSQSGVSQAGTTWECFVCWYLNLCLIGSRTVVFRQSKHFIPQPISEALTVTYNTFRSNTESDLIAITFPDRPVYTDSTDNLVENSNHLLDDVSLAKRNGKLNYLPIINLLADVHFQDYQVVVIQCKTNWNDNAQIPMLWDMIYSAEGFNSNRNIVVGTNGYSIRALNRFAYAFATVPTVALNKLTPTSISVRRVANLSGGNYWGHSSVSGVANSLKEIFNRHFSDSSHIDIRNRLTNEIENFNTEYAYFRVN